MVQRLAMALARVARAGGRMVHSHAPIYGAGFPHCGQNLAPPGIGVLHCAHAAATSEVAHCWQKRAP